MNGRFTTHFFLVAAALCTLFAFVAGSGIASAQCGGPNCPAGYLIDPNPDLLCCAPIDSLICNNGTAIAPSFSAYCPTGGLVLEPCVCMGMGRGGLAAILVGTVQINVGTGACVNVNGCELAYDVQVDADGCIRVKITNC